MDGGGLMVPVGIDIPFGQASIGMGPDDFVLTIDGVSRDLGPALVGAIANTASASGDVIKGSIGELNPPHAGGIFLEFNGPL